MKGLSGEGWMRGIAAVAFLVVLGWFALEIFAFRSAVETWAHRDLASQARLAAASLEEPLRTQDFRRIRELSDELKAKELSLVIRTSRGGILFSSDQSGEPMLGEGTPCADSVVEVRTPLRRVHEPFSRSLKGFALALSVGAIGMLLFFLASYRQHVRIRELKKLENFRRTFIADVSHEIKTPLTGILGAADMLEGSSPLVAMIKKEAARLNRLVQQILDLARLERSGLILNRVPTDVCALTAETVTALQPAAEQRGIALRYEGAATSAVCAVDPERLGEVISNLVLNALRHSQSPDIVVSCKATPAHVEVAVEDHGIGIPPEHVAHVFERFHRVDPARAAETGGAGLGLAIARQIARLHGGDITLTPVSPHGCRFTLSVPV